jgi:uncharacterized protein (DUF1330 family)
VIIETDVREPEQYERYKAASPDTIAADGGRFVACGGELAVLEGDWHPSRLLVLEFEDLETVKRGSATPTCSCASDEGDGIAAAGPRLRLSPGPSRRRIQRRRRRARASARAPASGPGPA